VVELQISDGPSLCPSTVEAYANTIMTITQTWNTYCFTILSSGVASITFEGIVSNPDGTPDTNTTALILVDHVVPVASCL
jgi:hypothetical protein